MKLGPGRLYKCGFTR